MDEELRRSIVESIKIELGFPEVDIYIKDSTISTIIDKALRRVSSSASNTSLASKSVVSGKIDVSDLNVSVVRNIYQGFSVGSGESSDFGSNIFQDINNITLTTGGMGLNADSRKAFYDTLARIGQMANMQKLAMYDYYLDGDVVYVDNYSGEVVLEYIKKDLGLDDLTPEWRIWVELYATAISKIAEGRVRGKYRVQGAPFEINADELISEGQSEKSELENRLENSMGYFNILR